MGKIEGLLTYMMKIEGLLIHWKDGRWSIELFRAEQYYEEIHCSKLSKGSNHVVEATGK